MSQYYKRTWVEINLNALEHNLTLIKSLVPNKEIMAVVKADAYGHGDRYAAGELQSLGVNWFAVSNIEEAISLRKNGITKDILIFGRTPAAQCFLLEKYNITQTVFSRHYADELQTSCRNSGIKVKAHIKVDTGMGRLGFVYSGEKQQFEAITYAYNLENIRITGIYTHLSHADSIKESAREYTLIQLNRMNGLVQSLRGNGYDPGLTHAQNSAGIINYPEGEFDLVRPGIILYGLYPGEQMPDIGLKPVMELKSIISMIKTVRKGESIGYGQNFTAPDETRIATIPIGYADGYSRSLSGKGCVLVNGKRAKITGNVCMDQIMADVTDINAEENQIVTLFGKDGGAFLSVDELAKLTGTINYEIVCLIGRRVPRIYKKNKEVIAIIDYLDMN